MKMANGTSPISPPLPSTTSPLSSSKALAHIVCSAVSGDDAAKAAMLCIVLKLAREHTCTMRHAQTRRQRTEKINQYEACVFLLVGVVQDHFLLANRTRTPCFGLDSAWNFLTPAPCGAFFFAIYKFT